jgi:hypothetical protein
MKWNRATAVLSAVFLAALLFSVGLKNRVLASQQTANKMAQAKAPAKKAPSTDPSSVGQWGAPIQLGIVPIHAALVQMGQTTEMLFWQYYDDTTADPPTWTTTAVLFNPSTQTVTPIPVSSSLADFFCSGSTHLYNGELLIDGGLAGPTHMGANGSNEATIFDPATSTFHQNPPGTMYYARYYPTNIAMPPGVIPGTQIPAPDGYQLVVSGENANQVIVPQLEAYDPSTSGWIQLNMYCTTSCMSSTIFNLPPAAEPWNNYPRMFLLPTATEVANGTAQIPAGSLYVANQLYHTWFFNPWGSSVETVWPFIGDYNEVYRYRAAQVMIMPPPRATSPVTVMLMGGQEAGYPPTKTTETVNLSSATPAWTYNTPMATARHDLNAVQLPDGTILGVGGASGAGDYQDPVYAAELFTPSPAGGLGTWTTLASQLGQRGYHSVALLLPNGTVLSAGSDSGTQYQTYAEIYSPPYLFKGAQPVISEAPDTMEYGQTYKLSTPTPSAIGSVALIREDALTHADHMDQSMQNLAFTPVTGTGTLQITPPPNANYAPPGYYMLFILNTAGVPSVAKIVQVQAPTTEVKNQEAPKAKKL